MTEIIEINNPNELPDTECREYMNGDSDWVASRFLDTYGREPKTIYKFESPIGITEWSVPVG